MWLSLSLGVLSNVLQEIAAEFIFFYTIQRPAEKGMSMLLRL